MEDMLYNLPFIHRTYCLTYTSQADMFVPLKNVEYVRNETTGEVFFRGEFVSDVSTSTVRRRLPATIIVDPDRPTAIRSAGAVSWAYTHKASAAELERLADLHSTHAAKTPAEVE